MSLTKNQSGFTLVEVLLAMTLFAMFATGFVYVSIDTLQRDAKVNLEDEALAYAQEGVEAVRAIRAEDFFALTVGAYGLNLTNDVWSFTAAPEAIDSFFERTITIEDVYRDGSGNIVSAGGTLDIETKKIISEVTWTWQGFLPRTVRLESYLTNWTGDDFIQTTCDEFDNGTLTMMDSNATAAPPVNNCALSLTWVEAPSDFYSSADIGEHGSDVDVEGTIAYLASEKSFEGLAVVDISDVENPLILDKLDIGGKGRSVIKQGNYLYMGVENSSRGLAIANVSNPSNATVSSRLNVSAAGNRAAISGSYLYMGTESSSNSFKVVDVSNPSSPSVIRSVDVNGKVKDVALSGNYAFVAVENSTRGLQVIDISNPAAATKVAHVNLNDEEGTSLVLEDGYAYVGTLDDAEGLKVVSISDPLSPVVLSNLDLGEPVQDVNIQGNYLYAGLDDNDPSLAVVRLHNTPNLTVAFYLDTEGKVEAVATNENHVFLATDIGNEGLVIVGTANTDVADSGDFVSQALDLGSEDVRYNFLKWEATVAPGGSVRFQLRTASSVGGLSSATWVGPDGTNSTYFETSPTTITLDGGRSGQRYTQLKLFMTSDSVTSSTVESITLNYTP